MDDPRAADSAEHLQTAARELIRAARSFLDLVEDVVEDPDRLAGAASSVAGMVRDGLGQLDRSSRSAPWAEPAWQEGGQDGDTIDLDDLYDIDDSIDGEEPEDIDDAGDLDEPDEPDGPAETSVDAVRPATRTRAAPSRVRRIAVE